MFSISLTGFVLAALIVLLIPGPGVLYIIARSISQGYEAGLVSVLGLAAGALVHVVAATLGLSAILLTSATAFGIVKLLGAGYLIYLGIQALVSNRSTSVNGVPRPHSMSRLFADGVVVSILNPKIALFFLAFLPQFVDPAIGSVPYQVFYLGILYVLLAIITDGAYALLAGHLRHRFGNRLTNGPITRYASGSVYLGLGIGTALSERS